MTELLFFGGVILSWTIPAMLLSHLANLNIPESELQARRDMKAAKALKVKPN